MRRTVPLLLLLCRIACADPIEGVLEQSRRLATTGHRSEALETLRTRLAERPSDLDCRTFYGIVLSWEGRYPEARTELTKVLEASPQYSDALLALIRVELWSDRPDSAERLATQALLAKPGDSELVLLDVKALRAQHRDREAGKLLRSSLRAEPSNSDLRKAWEGLEPEGRVWDVTTDHSHQWFSDGRSPWSEDQIAMGRSTPLGAMIGRVSFASRFGTNSRQAELDFYPRFRPGTYGFVNVGWSPDARLYPQYRLGADLFQSLTHGWEGSAGFRRLGFSGKVNIFTGALTRYHGNWMFTARTYLTPDSQGTSRSVSLLSRHYFHDGISFIGFRVGRGASPTETRSVQDIEILNSTSFSAQFRHSLNKRLAVDCSWGLSAEDRLNRPGLRSNLLDISLRYGF